MISDNLLYDKPNTIPESASIDYNANNKPTSDHLPVIAKIIFKPITITNPLTNPLSTQYDSFGQVTYDKQAEDPRKINPGSYALSKVVSGIDKTKYLSQSKAVETKSKAIINSINNLILIYIFCNF